MPDRNATIKRLQDSLKVVNGWCCRTDSLDDPIANVERAMEDALELLKAQEPRLVVKEDFINADRWGYLPVYVEDRDGTGYWDCITDSALGDTVSRFWTMKPTDEQRKAVKWDA